MITRTLLGFAALSQLAPTALANPGSPDRAADSIWQGREKVGNIAPVFGQLVRSSLPKGFQLAPVYEKTAEGSYTRETVLEGETADAWTQMITIGGTKDLASNPEASARKVTNNIAGGFKKACPASFNAAVYPIEKIEGREAFAAVVSCGISPLTQGRTSETALLVVVKGDRDYYSFKWSERTGPSSTPMAIDLTKWSERLNLMMPIQLCPIVPGERAPYPSCIDKQASQASQ